MTSYDSDSSGVGDLDYTETSVLLGYASKEPSDDTISHLGGRPTWLDPTIPPSAALVKCRVCKDLMVLLLQLNGDLPEIFPGHERRLYVLACRRKTCRRKDGSIRTLRGVRISELVPRDRRKTDGEVKSRVASPRSRVKAVATANIGESLFGVKPVGSLSSSGPSSVSTSTATAGSPFSSSSAPSINPFSASNLHPLYEIAAKPVQDPVNAADLPKTFAAAVSLDGPPSIYGPVPPPEPWPHDSEFPPPYPLYYLADADYETLDKVLNETSIPRQMMDEEEDGPSSTTTTSRKEDKDIYESTMDKTFQKFADRLEQNPEQVIRYEFRGQPLLYSNSDAVGKLLGSSQALNAKITVEQGLGSYGMPRCGNCGAGRVFEMQLTPHAISELEADDIGLEGMEWGTIIVGVCEKDCLSKGTGPATVGYLEEYSGVQWEETKEKR